MAQDKFFLVSFYGIPYWEEVKPNKPCSRRYLFSSLEKAWAFVLRRTDTPAWVSIPPQGEGSMGYRMKWGSPDGYSISVLKVDDADGAA